MKATKARPRGNVATTFFALICLCGIAVMLLQTDLEPPSGVSDSSGRSTAADPPLLESRTWSSVVPSLVEQGLRAHVDPASKPAVEEPRLRLR